MAEEVKVSKFAKFRKSIAKFFREIKTELKKVVWLTKEQLIHNTVTVIVTCLIIGAIIWIADLGLNRLLKLWVS